MKKLLSTLLPCLALFLLASSCLEINEQVRMHKEGSGQFTFTVDMHEAKPLLDLARSFSDEPEDATTELNTGLEKAYDRLQHIKGIRNVARIDAEDGLLSGITFEFSNVAALNKGLNAIKENEEQQQYFTFANGKLHRLNTFDEDIEMEAEAGNDLPNLDLTIDGKSMKDLMKSMVYRTEYTFDEPVKSVSNPSARLSADKRKVTVERYLLDDSRQASSLENVIQF